MDEFDESSNVNFIVKGLSGGGWQLQQTGGGGWGLKLTGGWGLKQTGGSGWNNPQPNV